MDRCSKMSNRINVVYCWVLLMLSAVVFISYGYFYNTCYSFEMRVKNLNTGLQQGWNTSIILDAEKKPDIMRPNQVEPKTVDRLVQKAEPTIFAITPTYSRMVQKAELTRLSQTFLHVTNFHWILVEDSDNKTTLVTNLLQRSGLNYTHLNISTSEKFKFNIIRGAQQRNIGIDWLLTKTQADEQGVVYFADDDNTYSLRLFEEMRYTNKVSVWPVGLAGGRRYEAPILNDTGHIIGWKAWASKERKFAIDMAGFAVSLSLFHEKRHVRFTLGPVGYLETRFLEELVTIEEMEPKADMCTKVYVWHTQTSKPIIISRDSNSSYVEI